MVMRRVGLPIAVANAAAEVKAAATFVTRAAGGHGAVREVIEALLKARGEWPGILERYFTEPVARVT
jgi:3-deoxy-D-manno-octulosonate 8-phosphate phosphatase KdsC-like HAD superfamily phosphatase